jgi:N-acetylmuramoyl-L-alanine amidase CwlA
MTLAEALEKLNISVDLIPKSNSNRPGTHLTATYITIHNTDNDGPGADALAHAKYIKGADASKRKVSWHYTVDDVRCVRHLPLNEVGWHAGSKGNSKSVAIEICEHAGINQEKAIDRACLLTAVLMHDLKIAATNIVPHQHWTGKNCPKVILNTWEGGMQEFVKRATAYLAQIIEVP